MIRVLRPIGIALSYYSRIPIQISSVEEDEFSQATNYLPLVGYLVGLGTAVVIITLSNFLSTPISLILGLGFGLLFTGALHEDGFADSCDGFGGGYNKEKILAIMKDSRLGSYGVLGLILLMLCKYFSLANITLDQMIPVLVGGAVLSRLSALSITWVLPYARQNVGPTAAMVKGQGGRLRSFIIAVSITAPLLFFVNPFLYGLSLLVLAVTCSLMGYYFWKHLRGYTGDCLGLVQQVNELILWQILGQLL